MSAKSNSLRIFPVEIRQMFSLQCSLVCRLGFLLSLQRSGGFSLLAAQCSGPTAPRICSGHTFAQADSGSTPQVRWKFNAFSPMLSGAPCASVSFQVLANCQDAFSHRRRFLSPAVSPPIEQLPFASPLTIRHQTPNLPPFPRP
jgi:hypothetical protein